MKTIKERANECAFKAHPVDFIKRKAYIAGYIQGAINELAVLTEWHDPKDIPEHENTVLGKILIQIEDYELMWYDHEQECWIRTVDERAICDEFVIGWREIHE